MPIFGKRKFVYKYVFVFVLISIWVFHLEVVVNIWVICEISGKPILVRIFLYLLGKKSQTHIYWKVKFDRFVGYSQLMR